MKKPPKNVTSIMADIGFRPSRPEIAAPAGARGSGTLEVGQKFRGQVAPMPYAFAEDRRGGTEGDLGLKMYTEGSVARLNSRRTNDNG